MASKGATQAADDQLGKLAGSLLESLNKGGAEFIETPLEQLYHYFREKTWKKSSSDAFLQTWSACALLLDEDLNPEVRMRPFKRVIIWTMRVLISFLKSADTSSRLQLGSTPSGSHCQS